MTPSEEFFSLYRASASPFAPRGRSHDQLPTEVNEVVGQGRPQRNAAHLVDTAYQELVQPSVCLALGVRRLDRRRPVFVKSLGRFRTHPHTPLGHRFAVSSLGLMTVDALLPGF